MPAFDRNIRTGHYPTVRRHHYGRVVAGPHYNAVCTAKASRQGGNDSEFVRLVSVVSMISHRTSLAYSFVTMWEAPKGTREKCRGGFRV